MARAKHVKKASKAIPGTDIKAGDSYYWWKFRYGGKRYSKTPPRRSQLTQSAFYGAVYDLEDDIGALAADDTLPGEVEDIVARLREIADDCQSNRDNLPEALQDAPTGELLGERVDAMNNAADEFEALDMEEFEEETYEVPEQDEDESDDDYEERCEEHREEWDDEQSAARAGHWQEKLDEVQAITIEAP